MSAAMEPPPRLRLVDPAAVAVDPPRNQTSATYARLKAEVLGGRVAPGEKLKINEIAQRLDVSSGAVREALSRLVSDGLVLSRDQRGFRVAPLSELDLDDLAQMRCEIEELALRRAVLAGDADWEAAILGAAHRLRRTPRFSVEGGANPDWLRQHERFHEALVAACGSPRLLAIRAQLHQQSERYRVLSAQVCRERDVDGEHQALVDAALDRDAETLVRLCRAHIQRTARLVKEGFAATSDPEDGESAAG